MAYGLKYTAQLIREGHTYELHILQRDYVGDPKEIGDLAGMELTVQGGTSDIDAPILKTSLTVSMWDTNDIPDTATVKHGAWEEFFTNDATLYQVQVWSDRYLRWTGYVTPDSWEEDLTYRGRITITARDNIGHLEDFDFDAPGPFISVRDLCNQAFDKIEQLLTIDVNLDEHGPLAWSQGGQKTCSLLDVNVSIAAFEGKTWYKALEGTLSSLGLCIRYLDDNAFCLMSISGIATAFVERERTMKQALFINNTGHRMLTPAYKEIREKIDYQDVGENALAISDYTAVGSNMNFWRPLSDYILLSPDRDRRLDAPHGYGVQGPTELKDPSALILPIFTTFDDTNYISYKTASPTLTRLSWGGKIAVGFYSYGGSFAQYYAPHYSFTWGDTLFKIPSLKYQILWHRDGLADLYYYGDNGTSDPITGIWKTTPLTHTFTPAKVDYPDNYSPNVTNPFAEFGQSFQTPEDAGILEIRVFAPILNIGSGDGRFRSVITGTSIKMSRGIFVSEHTTRTIVNPQANLTANIDSEIGQYLNRAAEAGMVKNALLDNTPYYAGIEGFSFEGDPGIRFSCFWELKHRWIMQYHGAPMNILTGDLYDDTENDVWFDDLWSYSGKKFVPVAGTLDFTTGILRGAILHEYATYSEIFEDWPIDSYQVKFVDWGADINFNPSTRTITVHGYDEAWVIVRITTSAYWPKPQVGIFNGHVEKEHMQDEDMSDWSGDWRASFTILPSWLSGGETHFEIGGAVTDWTPGDDTVPMSGDNLLTIVEA